ncbi:MAG: hypothetical protein IJ721_06620 [Bacteroidales bacterium]|nr:hypothetical protein [Bacteroidales bacterium]
MRQADIFIKDIFCGILTEDEEEYHFRYAPEYLQDGSSDCHFKKSG